MPGISNMSDEAQNLARVPLFQRLEPHEVERLAQDVEQVYYNAGEVIFYEDDTGDALYVIEEAHASSRSSLYGTLA